MELRRLRKKKWSRFRSCSQQLEVKLRDETVGAVSRQLAAAEGTSISETGARIYRPSFRENRPKSCENARFLLVKTSVLGLFRENCVYKFGHGSDDENCLHIQPLLTFMYQ
jgi:hypothetical protein